MDDFTPIDTIEPAEAMPAISDPSNLAILLGPEDLQELGEKVVTEYEADLASRSDWEKRMAIALKLFAGIRDPKSFPWPDSSNVHIPIMGVACLQFQARAYEALVLKETARCFSTDGKAIEQAGRCTKYINWQLLNQMEEWEEEMDLMLLLLPIYGCLVKKTYQDKGKGRPASRLINIANFAAPYGAKSLADAERKTHAFPMSINDIKKAVLQGGYLKFEGMDEGSDHVPSPELKEMADKVTGLQESNLDKTSRTILEQHRYYDMNGDGIEEPVIVWVDEETKSVLRIETRVYQNPVTGKEEIAEHFTDYIFFPNPESWMGIGFGHLLQGLNEASNTLINQIIDAGTLANLSGKTGFISKQYGGKKGHIELQLGKWTEVDVPTEDLKKSIFPLTFNDTSASLFNLLGLLEKYSKEIASLSESLLGQLPPSDTTATSMMAVMEQGLKVYSTIHKRVHRSLKKELQKIFYLNSLYMDENVYFMVQDQTSSTMEGYSSGREDFMNNIDVIPASDPNITSRAEKLIKAQQAYQAMAGNPLVMENPIAIYEFTKDYLEAMEVPNIDRFKLKETAQIMLQLKLAQLGAGGMNGTPDQPGGMEGMEPGAGNEGIPGGTPLSPGPDATGQFAQGGLMG